MATRLRLQREAELRENLAGSARIGGVVVEQMTDAIVTTDASGRVTAINPAGERLYGLAEEEAVGHRVDEIVEQLRLDGAPLGSEATDEAASLGYWHGRVVHRPLIGGFAGRSIVVDLSLTSLRDDHHKPAGLIAMSHEVVTSARMGAEAAALGSLAVATGRARSRREVAEAALERLCEATMADVGIIATWGDRGAPLVIEASRGLSPEVLEVVRLAEIADFGAALEAPGAVIPVESLGSFLNGTEVAAVMAKEGLRAGFLVDLRSRDESVGFLALGARRPAWGRPGDEVILQAAAQVVGALDSARLMERLERGLEQERRLTVRLEALMGLTLLPQGDIDESTLALFLLERVVGALGADGGLAVRASDDGFRVIASHRVPTGLAHALETRPASEFHFWHRLTSQPAAGAFQQLLTEAAAEGGRVQEMIERRRHLLCRLPRPRRRPRDRRVSLPLQPSGGDGFRCGRADHRRGGPDHLHRLRQRPNERGPQRGGRARAPPDGRAAGATGAHAARRLHGRPGAPGAGDDRGGRRLHRSGRRRVHPGRPLDIEGGPHRLGRPAEPQLGRHERVAGDTGRLAPARPTGVRGRRLAFERQRRQAPAPRRCCRCG